MNEAAILTNYLIGKYASEHEQNLYDEAIKQNSTELSIQEEKLWAYMILHPWCIPYLDAALALKQPNGTIRRRIFTMLAILEASPAHTDFFLPKKFHPLYIFKFLFSGIRAIVRAIIGLLILKLL